MRKLIGKLIGLFLMTGSVISGQSGAQATAPLAWKEFSIGPATKFNTRFSAEGLRTEGIPFKRAIARAYGVPEFRVVGPDWLATQRYAITAIVSDPQEFQPLFQQELAKRFQLATHWESRELSIYTLKPIEGFPHKLRPHTEGGGSVNVSSSSVGNKINLPNSAMGQFVILLAESVERPVFDETDLAGRFDFYLTWPATKDASPIAAVKDQLGLQLVEGKRAMDVLVVDHAEKLALP